MSDPATTIEPFAFARDLAAAGAQAETLGVSRWWTARVRQWLLRGRDTSAMERDSARAWQRLTAGGPLLSSRVVERRATADGAVKLRIGLADGESVETVVLPSPRGVSVCLSTQVGCPVGCRFCASGRDGLTRNLAGHEIVEQLVHARRERPDVDRAVIMGIGEPLLNPDALFFALDRIREEGGIGPRRTIVSTVGPRGGIRRLSAYGRKVTLALSLHAPDDALRRELIPSLGGVDGARIADLLAEVDAYIASTGRKAMAAYTLLAGVNDADPQAARMGKLLEGREIYLNVIPFNPVAGSPFRPVTRERALRFTTIVRQNGAFATVRATLGGAEHAACGQLRARAAGA